MSNSTKESLLQEKQQLEKLAAKLEKETAHEIDGRIRVKNDKGTLSFYHVKNLSNTNGVFIPKENKKLISMLLQKRYNHLLSVAVQKKLILIRNFINQYYSISIQNLVYKFHTNCYSFVKFYELPDELFFNSWENMSYEGNPFPIDSNEFTTAKGERVRSKSEIIIANSLYESDIPYHYEQPLQIDRYKTIYPDFTILIKSTREVIYWEHLGKMDSDNYRFGFYEKLSLYSQLDIMPGKNLITTFEEFRKPLNVNLVKKIISNLT